MRKVIASSKAPAAVGPYSQGIQVGELLFISGQLPLDPSSGMMVSDDVAAQTRQVLENIKAIVEEAGSTLADVVKVTIYLIDLEHFGLVNEIYAQYFTADPPARVCVEVSRLPRDAAVEMDAICIVKA